MIEAKAPGALEQQGQQRHQVDQRQLVIAEALVGNGIALGQLRQARPVRRPVHCRYRYNGHHHQTQ
ncbi:hypothetical protein D3C78_1541660 [compost metagenome]